MQFSQFARFLWAALNLQWSLCPVDTAHGKIFDKFVSLRLAIELVDCAVADLYSKYLSHSSQAKVGSLLVISIVFRRGTMVLSSSDVFPCRVRCGRASKSDHCCLARLEISMLLHGPYSTFDDRALQMAAGGASQ